MSVQFWLCMECAHLFADKKEERFCCEAFPYGIPKEKLVHTDEREICNNGIKYEPEEN